MNLKEFLKPDWKKMIVTIVLLGVSFLYIHQVFEEGVNIEYGLPLPSIAKIYPSLVEFGQPLQLYYTPLPVGFAVDLVFWYLVSCSMFWIHSKVKKK